MRKGAAMTIDPELVAYATDDAGVVHAVVWVDWNGGSDLVVFCTKKRAGDTRTAAKLEPVTCVACVNAMQYEAR